MHKAMSRRSYLFVPGSRPERWGKAIAAGADAVIIDLEDAVAPQDKADARRAVLAFLKEAPEGAGDIFVRINSPRSLIGHHDLGGLLDAASSGARFGGIVVPKASVGDVALLGDLIADVDKSIEIGALIETCAGIEDAPKIAKASSFLTFLMFGGADLASELGVEIAWDPLLPGRARLVQAAAGAAISSIDMPWIALADEAGERAEMQRSFALGFKGRAAIHPKQVPIIHKMLAPDPDVVEQARRVIAAFEEAAGGVCLLDGRLVERPIIERSRQILARAGRDSV